MCRTGSLQDIHAAGPPRFANGPIWRSLDRWAPKNENPSILQQSRRNLQNRTRPDKRRMKQRGRECSPLVAPNTL